MRTRTEYRIVASDNKHRKVWRTKQPHKVDALMVGADRRYPNHRVWLETRETTDWTYAYPIDATNLKESHATT